MEKKSEIEVDLLELLYFLRSKIWIVLVVAIVFAIVGYVYTDMTAVVRYTASTSMYVYREKQELSYNSLQEASQLRKDCEILITGQSVSEEVVRRLALPISPGQVSGGITITSQENTRIIQVNYTDTDPQRAIQIANAVRQVAVEQIAEIMQVDVVQTVYSAHSAVADAGRSPRTTAILMALLGAVLTAGVFVVLFLLDDTIRTDEDVERYLGLSTLGIIPISAELETAKQPGEGTPRKGILGVPKSKR